MTDSQQDADRTPTDEATAYDVVDVAEAASRLGVTPDAIRARLHRGTLAGEKVDKQWRVHLPVASPGHSADISRQDGAREPTGARQDATGKQQGTTASGDSTDRTRQEAPTADLEPLAELIGDLTRRNEELSAAVGMWQARAMHLEEQVKQLTATVEHTGEAAGSPEPNETSDEASAEGEPEMIAERSVWARLRRWIAGG